MVYLTMTKWRPLQWCPFLSFYSIRREGRYKERLNIPFIQWGIFALILGGEIGGALNPSPLTFTHTPPCPLLITPLLPCTPLGLHVHVHLSAHHICTSRTLQCTFSTLHFTLSLYIVFSYSYIQIPKCMCNVAHPHFIRPTRVFRSRKSSRQRNNDLPNNYELKK